MTSRSVTLANDNLEAAFVGLADHSPAGETREFGSITAVSVGVPIPFFNRIFVFTPPSRADLSAAVAWMTAQEVPFLVTVPETLVETVVDVAADLAPETRIVQTDDSQPGMVLAALADVPAAETDLAIAPVSDSADLDAFVTVSAEIFDIPHEVSRELTPASVLTDDRLALLLGRVEGDPVACGLLIQTDSVAGVYNIGVLDAFRRRGYGEAMTWAVLQAGRDRGCEMGVLQSSEMGYGIYERMGFDPVTEYHQFALDSESASGDPDQQPVSE